MGKLNNKRLRAKVRNLRQNKYNGLRVRSAFKELAQFIRTKHRLVVGEDVHLDHSLTA